MQAEIERLKVEIASTPRDTSMSAAAAIKDVTCRRNKGLDR
jgi:uncharacterized small protein (DUF1192 family)